MAGLACLAEAKLASRRQVPAIHVVIARLDRVIQ